MQWGFPKSQSSGTVEGPSMTMAAMEEQEGITQHQVVVVVVVFCFWERV